MPTKLNCRVRRGLGVMLEYWDADHMHARFSETHPGVRRLRAGLKRDAHAFLRWAESQMEKEYQRQQRRDAAKALKPKAATPVADTGEAAQPNPSAMETQHHGKERNDLFNGQAQG